MPKRKILNHHLIDEIDLYAKNWNLRVEHKESHSISIWTSNYVGLHIRISIDPNDFFHFDFYNRTYSHFYNGERTDLHDTFTLFYAAFLKKMSICSVNIVNVYNPATGADNEIYANYLIPAQINPGLTHVKSINSDKLKDLISSLFVFEQYIWGQYDGCPCQECRNRLGYKFEYRWKDIDVVELEKIKNALGFNDLVNYMERTLPTWIYYRNFKSQTTLIKSEGITEFITSLVDTPKETIRGIAGELIVYENFNNYLSSYIKKKILKYFKNLGDQDPKIMPFENKIIAVGKIYILSLDKGCGLSEFKNEREKIRERHLKEFDILFKPSKISWKTPVNDSLFENLIKDLLEREPNVSRVRKLTHTNESDGGVDLVAEWLIPKDNIEKGEQPTVKINVIVQCKAYKNGVGKPDVQDIRDTVEHRNYEGYFLATSSYTKKSLSDHLDKLRTSGKIWVDWWTSSEIEDRLKHHEDLIIKYSSILEFDNN